MKKSMKIISGITGFIIIGGLLYFANGLLGNPISKKIAQKAAEDYMTETYSDKDFVIEDLTYNFKYRNYCANIESPSSIDTYFSVNISMGGKIQNDSYENVLNGWNTYERIEEEYRNMVEKVFLSEGFPLKSNIDFGTIKSMENPEFGLQEYAYGIKMSELEVDKKYDVRELAKTAGNIVYYAEDEEISFEKAAECLLILKEFFDKEDLPFYKIDFVLEKPHKKDGTPNKDDSRVDIANFLYTDIYEEGLEERIEEAHNDLMEFYKEQDAKDKY